LIFQSHGFREGTKNLSQKYWKYAPLYPLDFEVYVIAYRDQITKVVEAFDPKPRNL
jgi:hypothetical protein